MLVFLVASSVDRFVGYHAFAAPVALLASLCSVGYAFSGWSSVMRVQDRAPHWVFATSLFVGAIALALWQLFKFFHHVVFVF